MHQSLPCPTTHLCARTSKQDRCLNLAEQNAKISTFTICAAVKCVSQSEKVSRNSQMSVQRDFVNVDISTYISLLLNKKILLYQWINVK